MAITCSSDETLPSEKAFFCVRCYAFAGADWGSMDDGTIDDDWRSPLLSRAVMNGNGNDWVAYSSFEKSITWRMGDGIMASFSKSFFLCCCDWRSSLLYRTLAGFFCAERLRTDDE